MREGVRAGTRLRQRDKAKLKVTQGDDAKAGQPPQHALLAAVTSVMGEGVSTLNSCNATTLRRQSTGVETLMWWKGMSESQSSIKAGLRRY
jgi:hypothetical protein